MKDNKFKESQKVTIKRSEINFAPFNPKNHSKEEITAMKSNIKRVGLLGGIIVNKTTNNLIDGHKRIMSTDLIQGYDGTPEKDYLIGVEVTEMDEKTEKEQNVWQTVSRTVLDDELMKSLIPDIDYKLAGLSDFDYSMYAPDLGYVEIESPKEWHKDAVIINQELEEINAKTKQTEENTKIDRSKAFNDDTPENQIARHNEIEKIKDRIGNKSNEDNDGGMLSYVILSFLSPKNKESFMQKMGYPQYDKIIAGEDFSKIIERID